jgi:hypothetical protein
MLGLAVAGAWAIDTHRAAVTTVLGGVLVVEVLVALVAFMTAFRQVFREHQPDQIVEHGHHHQHEHPVKSEPVWPHQAWEGTPARVKEMAQ